MVVAVERNGPCKYTVAIANAGTTVIGIVGIEDLGPLSAFRHTNAVIIAGYAAEIADDDYRVFG